MIKKLFGLLAKTILMILLIAILLEIMLRITGGYRTYTEKLGHGYVTFYDNVHETWYRTWHENDTFPLDHNEFIFPYITNSFGIREREFEDADSSKIRVFFFGDSFTEGVGAGYDSSYPREIERLLIRDNIDAEVYNLGMSGNDPFYNMVLLRDKFMAYNPTHVVFTLNGTDFDDCLIRGGFERFQPDGTARNRPAPAFHPLFQHSRFFRFLFLSVLGYDQTLVKKSRLPEIREKVRAEIIDCIDSTNTVCNSQGAKFIFVTYPAPGEICRAKLNGLLIYQLDEVPFGYPHIDVSDYLKAWVEKEDCASLGWPVDGHYTAKGYSVLGDAMYRAINDKYPEFWFRP